MPIEEDDVPVTYLLYAVAALVVMVVIGLSSFFIFFR